MLLQVAQFEVSPVYVAQTVKCLGLRVYLNQFLALVIVIFSLLYVSSLPLPLGQVFSLTHLIKG